MLFNSLWSEAVQFSPSKDSWDALEQKLQAKREKGVYLIRDAADQVNLYVGKAEGTSQHISDRLKAHLSGNGSKGIAKRVQDQETLTVRWIRSDRPALTESALIIALTPYDNRRVEWRDDFSVEETRDEAARIGLEVYSEERVAINILERLKEERKQRAAKEREER